MYHELAADDSPLCVAPELFSTHLGVLSTCGANVLPATELVRALDEGALPLRTVVLTFDDGFAVPVREARPKLAAAGMRATFFCVAGHLGGCSDWPSRAPGVPVSTPRFGRRAQ
jgi:peptidoglycan/xylan/chitin deacetylase (PgdA/CDA1 family)